ncbi:TetR/AcrR family transcriptional regulator [Nonomuraea monospora]|uniref:TetR/AcrR family transcriptional regulator n=1 Tax=Nonomuraea monospora TaxID=568818 RepID=A0ABP5P0G9_9ACTN
MGRWEPNARERLVAAAVDLFAEQGYDSTTVSGIAERAGLTKTTFFRHFRDKREVLFAGQELHSRILADAIAAAPPSATPLQAVGEALDALAGSFTDGQQVFAGRLLAVIAANEELRERAAYKSAVLVGAMTEALLKRGAPDAVASLAAELGVRAFHSGFGRWAELDGSLPDLVREAFDEWRAASAALG